MKVELLSIKANGAPYDAVRRAIQVALTSDNQKASKSLTELAELAGKATGYTARADGDLLYFETSDAGFAIRLRVLDTATKTALAAERQTAALRRAMENTAAQRGKQAASFVAKVKALAERKKKIADKHGKDAVAELATVEKELKKLVASAGRDAKIIEALAGEGHVFVSWFVVHQTDSEPAVYRKCVPASASNLLNRDNFASVTYQVFGPESDTEVERVPKGARQVTEADAKNYLSDYDTVTTVA